ncbi:MAG: hypothetical protein ACE5FU_00095 [Nitrospinota bacterium]
MPFKAFVVNLALTFASVLVALIFIETGLRFTAYRSVLTHYKYPKGYYKNAPETGFDITPDFPQAIHVLTDLSYPVWSNNLGCFDNDYKNEEPFIYLAGDSFTWGYAPFKKKFGSIMEEILSTRVLKCGVSGFGTKQEYLKAQTILTRLKFKPRLIVVGYFIGNDFEDDYTFPNYAVHEGYRVQVRYVKNTTGEITIKENLKERYKYFSRYCSPKKPKNPALERGVCLLRRNSVLFNLVKGRIRSLQRRFASNESPAAKGPSHFLGPPSSWRERAFPDHFKNIRSFKTLAGEFGTKLLFVLVHPKDEVYPFLRERGAGFEKQTRLLKEFLDGEKIEYLDLLAPFILNADQTPRRMLNSEKDLYLSNDHHWTERGDLLAGLEISRHIVLKELVPVKEKGKVLSALERRSKDSFLKTQ